MYFYARNIVAARLPTRRVTPRRPGCRPRAGAARAEQLIRSGLGAIRHHLHQRRGIDAQSQLPVTTVHCTGTDKALLAPVDIPLHRRHDARPR